MLANIPSFPIDTELSLTVTFTTVAIGAVIDPSFINLFTKDPNGNITEYTYAGGQVTKISIGVYNYLLTPQVSGSWTYKWQGTGTAVATCDDQSFYVNPSKLIVG